MDHDSAEHAASLLEICQKELHQDLASPCTSSSLILAKREDLKKYLDDDDEIGLLVKEQNELELIQQVLLQKRIDLKSLDKRKDLVKVESELFHQKNKIASNEKRLVSKIISHIKIASNIRKLELTRQELAALLADAVRELREHGTFKVLEHSKLPTSFRHRCQRMAMEAKKEKATASALTAALDEEKRGHDETVKKLEAQIDLVKSDLILLEATYNDAKQNTAFEDKVVANHQNIMQKETELENAVDKLERTVLKESRDHNKKVQQIKEEIELLKLELEEKRKARAKSIDSKMMEMNALEEKREENLNGLVDLQQRSHRIEAEEAQIKLKQEQEQVKERNLQALRDQQRLAVASIQVSYRIYKRRQAKIAAASSSKSKKKGKKKAKGVKK